MVYVFMFVYMGLLQKNNFAKIYFNTQKIVGCRYLPFVLICIYIFIYIHIFILYVNISILCIGTSNVLLFSTGLQGYTYTMRILHIAYCIYLCYSIHVHKYWC